MHVRAMAITVAVIAIAVSTSATLVSAQSSTTLTCHSYGAVSRSSATVSLPSHTRALRYFVTVTADQVPNATQPQGIYFQGALQGDLSATMNLATYNEEPYPGVIGFWDSLSRPSTGSRLDLDRFGLQPWRADPALGARMPGVPGRLGVLRNQQGPQ